MRALKPSTEAVHYVHHLLDSIALIRALHEIPAVYSKHDLLAGRKKASCVAIG